MSILQIEMFHNVCKINTRSFYNNIYYIVLQMQKYSPPAMKPQLLNFFTIQHIKNLKYKTQS
jgi:hypothetical protein